VDLGLAGKVAVVTGSSRGIGRATALLFAEEGVKLVVNGRNQETVEAVVKEVRSRGGEAIGFVGDVSKPEDVSSLFDTAVNRFGGLDIAVNNAGLIQFTRILDMSLDEWEEVVAVNLRSVFLCSKKAAEVMKERGGGVILNASSFAAVIPSVGAAAYGAAKAAVINFTRTLAAEVAPYGIRANSYVPGVIETDMTAPARARSERVMLDQISMHRFGSPFEMARPLVLLAAPVSGYISGAVLEVTGGKFTVQNPAAAWAEK